MATTDMEALAKSLMNSVQGAKIAANYDKFSQILSSPQGKKLLESLAGDGGDALKKAATDAKNGNMDTAKGMVSSLLSTKEGADLVKKILDVASK